MFDRFHFGSRHGTDQILFRAQFDLNEDLHVRSLTRDLHVCQDTLPEWSEGVDSSSTSAGCMGSNPTGVIFHATSIKRTEKMTSLYLRIDSNNGNQHLGDCTLRFMSTRYLSKKCQGDLILKNYETNWIRNAETRDRTGDLQIFSPTLSQLSHRGSARIVGLDYAWDCLGAITLDLDRMLTMKPS
jgi:hypothetical protein